MLYFVNGNSPSNMRGGKKSLYRGMVLYEVHFWNKQTTPKLLDKWNGMHEIHFCGQMRYHGKVCSARATIHSPLMSPLQPEPF